jgi:hypothetical protein
MLQRDGTLSHNNSQTRIEQAAAAAMNHLRRHQSIARVIGSSAVAAVLTLAAIYGPQTRSERQLAATIQMERFARRLELIKQVPPETAAEIARIVSRPEFDCAKVRCRPALVQRNTAVRAYLLALINSGKLSDVSSVGHSARH